MIQHGKAGLLTKGQYKVRVILALSVILAFSCIVLTIFSNHEIRKVREQFIERAEYQLNTTAQTIVEQIESSMHFGSVILNESSVIQYFHPQSRITDSDRAHMSEVMNELARLESLSRSYILSHCIFFQGDDYVITSAGTYSKSLYFERILNLYGYDRMLWEQLPANSKIIVPMTKASTRNAENIDVLLIATTLRRYNSTLVHLVAIPIERFDRVINSSGFPVEYRLRGMRGEILLASPEFNDARFINSYVSLSTDFGNSGYQFDLYIDNSTYYINLEATVRTYVILLITFLIIGAALVFTLSRGISRPITRLNDTVKSFATGNNEIEKIESGVNHLIMQNERLEYESVSNRLLLCFNGIIRDEANLALALKRIWPSEKEFLLLCILSDSDESDIKAIASDLALLFDGPTCMLITIESNLIEMIIGMDKIPEESIRSILMQGLRGKSALRIGISYAERGLNNLKIAHEEAIKAIPPYDESLKVGIRTYNEIESDGIIHFTISDKRSLANIMAAGSREEFEEHLNALIARNINNNVNSAALCELLQQILLLGRNTMEIQAHSADEIALLPQFIKSLSGRHEEYEMEALVTRTISLMLEIQRIAFPKNEEGKGKTLQIRKYINENYMNELSLDIIADHVRMSPKYVSHIFKEENGENISDYIVRTRVDMAKNLLVSTNMKIGDIAASVGIQSRATFLRVFQKLEGISPSEYKNIKKRSNIHESS